MEKSFTDMVIAKGWTKQQRDATSVTRDKVFGSRLNTERTGAGKAACRRAAGMSWRPRETLCRELFSSPAPLWRLEALWHQCFCVGLRLRLSYSDPLHLQPPLWMPFKLKLQCFLVKRVVTGKKALNAWNIRGNAFGSVFTLFVTITKSTTLPSGRK